MRPFKSGSRVLWYESLGFGLMILLTWVDAWTGLSRLVFGDDPHPHDWRVTALQSGFILLVWLVVFLLTRRLVAHLHYLEGFMRVCAWCRKVGYRGQWIPLEQYLAEGLHVETSHGMCPECFEKVKEDTARFRRSQQPDAPAPDAKAAAPGTRASQEPSA